MSLPHTVCPNPSRKYAMPRVAMKRTIGSWFTRRRSTSRPMNHATATMMATVTASATMRGIFSISRTSESAAKSTIAPWAKLKTPDALKISTSPIATSEYSTPDMRPPRMTSSHCGNFVDPIAIGETAPAASSTKKAMVRLRVVAVFILRKETRGSSVLHPEVRVDHRLVGANLVRRAVGDLPAVVEHHHAVGEVHDDAHVVLDQHDGGAELVVHIEDEAAHVLLFLDVHAGHGLVEEQHPGLGGERAAEVDALL